MWNQLKTMLLLGAMSAVLIGVGAAFGSTMLLVFAGLALVMNVGSYYFSDRLILSMHGAQEVSEEEQPELHQMVAEMAANAGIPKPKVCVIPESYANAFATGRNPQHGVVAVTQGILDLLPNRELRGVIAHEIAHIKNRDILIATIAAVIGSAITYVANATQFAALFGIGSPDEEGSEEAAPSPYGGLMMAIVAPFIATLMQMAVSRSREYVADAAAAQLTGDPQALALALRRLHEPESFATDEFAAPATASLFIVNPLFGDGGISNWFSTHPPFEDRCRRLEKMADDVLLRFDVNPWVRHAVMRQTTETA